MRHIAILLVLVVSLVVSGLVFRLRQAPEAVSVLAGSGPPVPRSGGPAPIDETALRLRELFPPQDPKQRADALAKGRAEAEEQLKANTARIWTWGLNLRFLDWETGLYANCFGSVVDDELIARIEGHNARIAESIRDQGLPKNSFKPWEKELRGLKDYFEDRSRTEKPIRLTIDGPEARSRDGQFAVKLAKRFREVPVWLLKQETPPQANPVGLEKTEPGVPEIVVPRPSPAAERKTQRVEGTYLIVNGRDTEADRITMFHDEPELIWGPKGSWFAVLKVRRPKDNSIDYEAIDLREMRHIYP